jgi:hypothetical protein
LILSTKRLSRSVLFSRLAAHVLQLVDWPDKLNPYGLNFWRSPKPGFVHIPAT